MGDILYFAVSFAVSAVICFSAAAKTGGERKCPDKTDVGG